MSNIKFYTENVALYTLNSPTSEATGYEKEFMLDRRLATYWKANSGAAQYIPFDLGADASIDYVLIYADLDNGDTVQFFYDSNSDYSTETQAGASANITTTGWQVVCTDFTAVTSDDRYWRVKITPASAAPSVSTIFIGAVQEITQIYDYPNTVADYDYSGVKIVDAYGGQRGSVRQTEPRRIWQVKWDILDSTNKGKLDTIIQNAYGSQYPIYYQDSADAYYFVRLMTPKLNPGEFTHQLFRIPEFTLAEELGSPA